MGARYYGSALGRFVTPDPEQAAGFDHMDDPQAWNGYAYVRNNPLKYVDPDGDNFHVCDEHGQNCRDQSDTDFNRTKNSPPPGEIYKDGKIYVDGEFRGTYNQTDIDLPGDRAANQQAAAMIVATTNAAMKEFGKNALSAAASGVIGFGIEAFQAASAARVAAAAADVANLSNKIVRQMAGRGWTTHEFLETVQNGKAYGVTNKATGGPATEYIGSSGKFIVVDSATKQVIQISKSGYSPNHLVK